MTTSLTDPFLTLTRGNGAIDDDFVSKGTLRPQYVLLAAEAVAAVAELLLQVEAGPGTIRTELRDACFAVKEIPNRIL
jgi:hypothetical protein